MTPVLLPSLALALLCSGCVIQSFDPKVPAPEPEDSVVVAQAESSEDADGVAVAMTSSLPHGRLLASSQVTVIRPDAQRQSGSFESQRGASVFEQQVADRYGRGDALRERHQGGIPLLYAAEEKRVLSENAFYNEQLGLADANRDGLISDREVHDYQRGQVRSKRR